MWKACKERCVFSLALKLLNTVNSGASVQCHDYSVREVSVSRVVFVCHEPSEGWLLCLCISFSVTYRKPPWVGRSCAWQLVDHCSLCVFWDLLNACLFPLLKFLYVTLVDWVPPNPSQNAGCCVITAP